jgi:hypothetical protein
VGPNDLRYSAIEGTGNAAHDAAFPVLATDGTAAFNALWAAMVWRISMFDFYDEVEIFGQKIEYWIFGGGFEDGTLGSWSVSAP